MDQDKYDQLVSVRAEIRGLLRLLAPGWDTVPATTEPRKKDEIGEKIGERKYKIFVEMKGSLYIWQKESGQIAMGGVVYYKPFWIPKSDNIIVRHEEVELEWLLGLEGREAHNDHNDRKVIEVVTALDRAALSFGALQLAQGKAIPQRKPVSNRLVGW